MWWAAFWYSDTAVVGKSCWHVSYSGGRRRWQITGASADRQTTGKHVTKNSCAKFDDDKIVAEYRLLAQLEQRIHDVSVSSRGTLLLLTDSSDGAAIEVVPVAELNYSLCDSNLTL